MLVAAAFMQPSSYCEVEEAERRKIFLMCMYLCRKARPAPRLQQARQHSPEWGSLCWALGASPDGKRLPLQHSCCSILGSSVSRPLYVTSPLFVVHPRQKTNCDAKHLTEPGVRAASPRCGLCWDETQLQWAAAELGHEVLSGAEVGERCCWGNGWVTRQGAKRKDVERLESKPKVSGWVVRLQRHCWKM